MEDQVTILTDGTTGLPVVADLRARLSAEVVVATEAVWKSLRPADAEHSHWDWALKTGRLAIPGARIMGVECRRVIEGMSFVIELGKFARLRPAVGQPLVYVDIVEAAPWNRRGFDPVPRYQGVGPTLVRGAVGLRLFLGYGGRIGLHSLAQSERFYERACEMHPLGPDPRYYGLVYFEFTAERAVQFLEREVGT